MVALPWEYRWSSCRAYALGEPDLLLAENPWYLALSPDATRRQVLWREFLLAEDPKEALVRRQDWVIGDPSFRQRMQQRPRPLPRGRGRPRRSESSNKPPDTKPIFVAN